MKLHVSTPMADGYVTRWGHYTMGQPVVQSKTVKIASPMGDQIWVTFTGDGNRANASSRDNKFRRWHFDSHNVTVSVYWSPFLVRGVEKSKTGPNHNELHVDVVDERWFGLGCHYCPGLNLTEIGFYDVMRKAIKTTLKMIIGRKAGSGNGIDVFLTSFSPSHFEGEWDKAGACPKTEPYKEGEKMVEGMDADMRSIAVEEIEAAKVNAKQFGGLRVETLDVTKLSLMRPDGHPGPYMYPFSFANGIQEHVQNDCVHWCLPGPIDTWNQIMLQVIKRWKR
ncbi:Protein ALTERED XYLOGLUCAN 4 [Hibiscus syriacus]|uniref:Protein ALTERED XYLOGLUCAN 4 n=1 Tax=Hibiscus syriacus TaxID=106335 RepID=A0A6A3AM75_HIBSY|nr:Protein ALTERED XYLOGLUCAN 4 [Hibiscus syriacus]